MSADKACLRCQKQKRRCDKIRPHCTLCKRLNKRCAYQLPTEAPRLLPVPDWGDLNPINLNYTLELQVFSIVGDGLQLREAASLYFRTVHTWFPVVSEERYYAQLASVRVKTDPTPSDFSLLTLCMALVCKEPIAGDVPGSARSLYVSIKSFVSILEAMGTNSLKIVQSRILLTIFEIGHAINPSAYISAAANVRAAMSLGLDSFTKDVGSQKYEEAQNVWRAVMIVDSYVSLENGQAPFTLRGQQSVNQETEDSDLANVEPSAFMKLARASQLLDQVLIHVYATSLNDRSNGVEGVEILKSLTSFMTTFQNGQLNPHPLSDSALAISRSAMLETLELGSRTETPGDFHCIYTSVNILKSLVREVGLGGEVSPPDETAALSVFLPHFLFKAAMVCLSDTRVSGRADPEPLLQPMRGLLNNLEKRWVAATRYLEIIEKAHGAPLV